MSQPSVIYWPPATGAGFQDAIAKSQALVPMGSNVPLQANIPGVPNTYKFNKVIRGIDITSTDDLTAVHFIISGIGTPVDGAGNPTGILKPIREDLPGVDGTLGNIAQSVNIYSQINSITVTAANATNFSIGFGQFGITDYIFYDYNRIASSFSSVSLQFVSNVSLMATSYMSPNRPEYPDISQGGILTPFGTINGQYITFIPAFSVLSGNANTQSVIPFPMAVLWTNFSGTTTDSAFFTFLQQGIE